MDGWMGVYSCSSATGASDKEKDLRVAPKEITLTGMVERCRMGGG